MKKKMTFDKKYPLFAKYITDSEVQYNMMENADLFRKYEAYSESIALFLFELDKRFDVETIKGIIVEAIIKLPDEIMISLITSYLNSDEAAKGNPEFIAFYNKTSNLGIASVNYIEKNGLVTNRSYKDIPNVALDALYNDKRTGYEMFKDVPLDDVYDTLSYTERKLVVDLICNNSFSLLDEIFAKLNINLPVLIKILVNKNFDIEILNEKTVREINPYFVMILFCLIMDNEETFASIENIKNLCRDKRFELIRKVITENKLVVLGQIEYESISNLTDDEVIDLLEKKELVLAKTEI